MRRPREARYSGAYAGFRWLYLAHMYSVYSNMDAANRGAATRFANKHWLVSALGGNNHYSITKGQHLPCVPTLGFAHRAAVTVNRNVRYLDVELRLTCPGPGRTGRQLTHRGRVASTRVSLEVFVYAMARRMAHQSADRRTVFPSGSLISAK